MEVIKAEWYKHFSGARIDESGGEIKKWLVHVAQYIQITSNIYMYVLMLK